MATVAERRFGDAEALCRTGDNARANGAIYLAGFVVEILLKARLVDKFPPTSRKRRRDLEAALTRRGERDGINYVAELKKIDAEWSILARYSTQTRLMEDARQILERVRRLKEVLK